MKRLIAISALTAFGLAPAIGFACEYTDAATSASTTPPALAAASPPPQATRVPAATPVVSKTLPAKVVKKSVDKQKTASATDKVAALSR